jgi:hypothetical protein
VLTLSTLPVMGFTSNRQLLPSLREEIIFESELK